jgi:DNA-binding transcriptional LysR family regulator
MAEDFNLHKLHIFVTLAEELHFTRSAEKLFMSQPALTRQIRALEDSIGVRLFERGTRSVALTRPGEVLLREARRVLDAAEVALAATLRAANSDRESLALGCVESSTENLLPRVMTKFCEVRPYVSVEVHQGHTRELERALLTGAIDCAIVRPPVASPDLEVRLLYTEPLVAVVPEAFEITDSVIDVEKLRDARFIIHSEELGTSISAAISQVCITAGFVPNIAETATSTAMVLGLVAAGKGVALLPKSYTLTRPFGVRMVNLRDTRSVCGVAVAWRPGSERDPVLKDLLRTIREAAPGIPDTNAA